jgi:hypothetical protein
MLSSLAPFDQHRTDRLLQYVLVVAADEDDWRDRELGPIHFLKYAYLSDLAYANRHDGQSFTGAKWQFYHFGPWEAQVHDRIEPALSAIVANKKTLQAARYDSDFSRFSLQLDRRELDSLREELENELPLGVSQTVKAAVHEFGGDTAALLRYVYLTPPMVAAAPGETLMLVQPSPPGAGFDSKPSENKLTASQRRRRIEALAGLKQRVRERLDRRIVNRLPVSPAPRYDAVFAAGTEWLDALAGDPVESVTGELAVSPEIWKSPARTDPDVP